MTEVRVEQADGVALVTLDAPQRRNSLTLAMVSEIVAAMDEIEGKGETGAVIITGAPPAFCAGASLDHLGDGGTKGQDRRAGLLAIYEGFLRVLRSPLPTIAAVNGAAVGAGMNLALACDLRLAGRRARFDTRFLQLGLHPGGGHTWLLQRIAGPQAAAAAVLFGEVLDGDVAEACGLVWRCVDDDALVDTARTLARQAASAPRELARRTKATLATMVGVHDIDTAIDVELDAQVWSIGQPDFAERLAALQAKIGGRS
jgi:enoyl-CoA hydratase